MTSRIGRIAGWTSAILVAAFTVFSAIMEFIPFTDPVTLALIHKLGVDGMGFPLGVSKLILTAIFLCPRTSTVGFVLMVGYYGGALATNITHGFTFADYAPIIVMFVLLTVSACYRNPELLSRLLGRPVPEQI